MSDENTRFYWIRHGEVEDRYHQVFGGTIDMNLSPIGRTHASAIADLFKDVRIDRLYSSPLKRALQTASPLSQAKDLPIVEAEGLREVDFGAWTGLHWDEVRARFGVSAFDWLDQLEKAAIPEAESANEFRARVSPCYQTLLEECRGQKAAVFCHGGVIRMLLSIQLNVPLKWTESVEVDYGSISIVETNPNRALMRLLNFTPWRSSRYAEETLPQ